MFTIGTCAANLSAKFGNRQDLSVTADGSLSINAVIETVKELTETYEFEELKYTTPVPPATTLQMTANQPIYAISTLLATIAANTLYPQFQPYAAQIIDITDVFTFWIWFSGGVNQAGRALKYRRVTTIDTQSYGITSNVQGSIGVAPPVYYTRFGNVLQVGPSPDQAYNYFVRVKLRHPLQVGQVSAFVPAQLSCTIAGGVVNGVTILNGGAGYPVNVTNIPLYFGVSPNGTQATGRCSTDGFGAINAFLGFTNAGSGYTVAPQVLTAAGSAQQIFMPDSWQEIIEYAACRRIAMWEGATEWVTNFDNELARKATTVAQVRKSQMQRDETHNERQLSLVQTRYTHA